MATQTFQPERVQLCMESSVDVYREQIAASIAALDRVAAEEAEHLVAVAGEDERNYAPRHRANVFETLCARIDEFLLDDDGGYYLMRAYLCSHERSAAVLEVWFQVTKPGALSRGAWFRHLVVGLDEQHVYADMGASVATSTTAPAE
ncbi:MAG TPA: hypothetical protein P5081_07510 [Phycisphaerae bacterium]|nr:hypothetical protein [Phycisphaerae bacterium]HRW52718.1 hypothetical protein [Phycisphaerae bacterium]